MMHEHREVRSAQNARLQRNKDPVVHCFTHYNHVSDFSLEAEVDRRGSLLAVDMSVVQPAGRSARTIAIELASR
jgi:hypothetical protein